MKRITTSVFLALIMLFYGVTLIIDSSTTNFLSLLMLFFIMLLPVVLMAYISFSMAVNIKSINNNKNFIAKLRGENANFNTKFFPKPLYFILGIVLVLILLAVAALNIIPLNSFGASILIQFIFVLYIIFSFILCTAFLVSTKLKLKESQQEKYLFLLDYFKNSTISKQGDDK